MAGLAKFCPQKSLAHRFCLGQVHFWRGGLASYRTRRPFSGGFAFGRGSPAVLFHLWRFPFRQVAAAGSFSVKPAAVWSSQLARKVSLLAVSFCFWPFLWLLAAGFSVKLARLAPASVMAKFSRVFPASSVVQHFFMSSRLTRQVHWSGLYFQKLASLARRHQNLLPG